jgi:hypothetical protein
MVPGAYPRGNGEKSFYLILTCGLYYKHITIVIDAPSVISKWRSKL